jgi:hypothetical protein
MKQRIMWILWPAFIVGAIAEMLFFAFIDPGEMSLFGTPIELGRTATYSLFFFFFWMMGACSSALTCLLQRSPFEVNRCPVDADGRPVGCPKRADGTCGG